ncbi:MAG: hypothetical protein MMC33_010347 [Icmadophila ericetorum]|nr:hypothetical protein [Icmadophila ericetorum]
MRYFVYLMPLFLGGIAATSIPSRGESSFRVYMHRLIGPEVEMNKRSDQDDAAYQAWPVEDHTAESILADQDEAAYQAWPVEDHKVKRFFGDQDEAAYQAWPVEDHKIKLIRTD